LKDLRPEDMLSSVIKGIIGKTGIEPKLINDVVVGNVLAVGSGATVFRMAALHAGYAK
jgi:acetyl-CoA acyltransferase 1